MKNQDEGLKKEIGVFGLVANMTNIIIGSGIFILPAIVAGILGPASIIAYIFCGLLVTSIMLCYAEAGSKISQSGGDYTYNVIAFGKFAGFQIFMIGFFSTICGIAAITNALINTLSEIVPFFQNEIVRVVFILLIFLGLTFINIRGIKQGIGLVKILTVAKILPITILIITGIFFIHPANLKWVSVPGFNDIGAASLILFFAYTGGEGGLQVGGEIKKPERTVPKAILITVGFVVLFYILVQIVVSGVLGNALDPKSATPLVHTAQIVLGSFGFTLLFAGAAISMFGSVSGNVLNLPRCVFAISRDNILPIPSLKKIHSKYATPHISIIVTIILSCAFTLAGGFQTLAVFSVAGVLLIYLSLSFVVLKFRKMETMKNKGFTIPGGALVPILSMIITLVFLSQLAGKELISILIFMGISSVLYLFIHLIRTNQQKGAKEKNKKTFPASTDL